MSGDMVHRLIKAAHQTGRYDRIEIFGIPIGIVGRHRARIELHQRVVDLRLIRGQFFQLGFQGGDALGGFFDLGLQARLLLRLGRDLGRQVLGFDTAAFLEVGLMDGETSINNQIGVDVELIPVTANIKLERPIYNQFSVYATAGLGYAFSDISGNGQSATDGGFIAQATAGVLYNITQQLEAFAGVRYMFLDSVNFGGLASDLELDNEIGWEIGLRYNF